jgi:tRNA pseudouridine55 synthase
MTGGILNVNKPQGMTSFAVVSLVRRRTGIRRVGHAGTLDPIADGVLPVCLGPATRLVEYIVSAPKTYLATIRLGEATDSYDSEGTVTATGDPSAVTLEDVEAALPHFAGEIDQLPPMYSALKYEGQPLYRYARQGKTVPRQPRRVAVHRLELLAYTPPLIELEMEVGRGAYVRSLAHDLGERLGCHGHLVRLTRTASGPFALADAVSIEELEGAADWEALLYAPDRVLESWQAALLGEQHAREVGQGRLVVLERRPELAEPASEAPCRAYSDAGEFLAVLRYRGSGRWQPEKVFAAQ